MQINISISDFPLICRVCLHKGNMRSLEENSLEVLGEIVNMNLTHQDGLPKNICIGCFKTLLEISMFIDRTKYNDMYLRYLLLNNQSNVKPELIELEAEVEASVVLSNNVEQSLPRSVLKNSEEIRQVNDQVDQQCKIVKKIAQEYTNRSEILQSQVKKIHAKSSNNKNVKKDKMKIPEYNEHCQEQSVDKYHDNKSYISHRNKNEELGMNQVKKHYISTGTTNDDIKKFNKTDKKSIDKDSIKQKCNSVNEFEVYDDDLNEIQLSEWSKIVHENYYKSLNKNKDIENWLKQVNEHKDTADFNSSEYKHVRYNTNNVKKYRISLCENNKSKEGQDDSNIPLEKKLKICCSPKNTKGNSKQKNIFFKKPPLRESKRVNLTCQLCSRNFSNKSSLRKHILRNVCIGFEKKKFLVYEENENFTLKENKPHTFPLKLEKDQGIKETIYNGFTLQNIVKSDPLDIVIKSEPENIQDVPNHKLKSKRQSEPLDDEILAIINQEFPPY